MGEVETISYDRFPKQGGHLGHQARVCFNYDTSRTVMGEVVRDDVEEPFVTIIKLEDGKYVLATECQYSMF